MQLHKFWLVAAVFLTAMFSTVQFAGAVNPDEVLEDPVLEERARELSTHLRCLVCQNQNIDSSDAPLAKDLRVLVRERLVAGDNDTQVLEYVVSRYGEFALLKPKFAIHTIMLWATPFIALVAGIGIFVHRARNNRVDDNVAALSDGEQEEIARLLAKSE